MPIDPESDLQWTAFLYMSGDLPLAEATCFEARLADDPAARDALLEAVELAEALAVVGPEFRPRRRVLGRRVLVGVVALAAAACVALALIPWNRPRGQDRLEASELAIAWSTLRSGLDSETVTAVEVEDVDSDSSPDRPLPSWLLSATSVPLGDQPREEQ